MIYKNFEIHNVAELIRNDDGSISWKRVPSDVHGQLEATLADTVAYGSTGVELRFVIKGESATVRMSTFANNPLSFSTFHVYRGGILYVRGQRKQAFYSSEQSGLFGGDIAFPRVGFGAYAA